MAMVTRETTEVEVPATFSPLLPFPLFLFPKLFPKLHPSQLHSKTRSSLSSLPTLSTFSTFPSRACRFLRFLLAIHWALLAKAAATGAATHTATASKTTKTTKGTVTPLQDFHQIHQIRQLRKHRKYRKYQAPIMLNKWTSLSRTTSVAWAPGQHGSTRLGISALAPSKSSHYFSSKSHHRLSKCSFHLSFSTLHFSQLIAPMAPKRTHCTHCSTRLRKSNIYNHPSDGSISSLDESNELQSLLDQLASLNGGKEINPRSPRQVAMLLYESDYSTNSTNSVGSVATRSVGSVGSVGPTDKATLLQIINDADRLLVSNGRDQAGNDGKTITHPSTTKEELFQMEEIQRRKKVAELVLQCRQLLSFKQGVNNHNYHNDDGKRTDGWMNYASLNPLAIDGTTFPSPNRWRNRHPSRQMQVMQVANVSNSAFDSNDVHSNTSNDVFRKDEDGVADSIDIQSDIQSTKPRRNLTGGTEETTETTETTETMETATSKLAPKVLSPRSHSMHATHATSPYEQMVRNLFPTLDGILDGMEDPMDDPMDVVEEKLDESISGMDKDFRGMDEDISSPVSLESPDPHWMEPLLSLTKPTVRSLVRQLQSTGCPMGYDPSASPFSSLNPTANHTNSSNSRGGATAPTAPKKPTSPTSLLSFVRAQKILPHLRHTILLIRVGDFYESYGIDALLLMEHCGLNPMAGKARAGCPWRNVQGVLDGLTSRGFKVGVIEEWNGEEDGELGEPFGDADDASSSGSSSRSSSSSSKLKRRYLAQIVSPANPTYMHGLVLNDDGSSALENSGSDSADGYSPYSNLDDSSSFSGRTHVGVIETHAGYTLVEISSQERTATVSERLTAEAVTCRLMAYPPADPLIYVPPYSTNSGANDRSSGGNGKRRLDRLPFLPWRQSAQSQYGVQGNLQNSGVSTYGNGREKVRVKTLPPSLVVAPSPGISDVERAKQTIVSSFLRLEEDSFIGTRKNSTSIRVSHQDFILISNSAGAITAATAATSMPTIPQPLHLETATQLGLMSDPSIPPLIHFLLPNSAPASSRRFLKRWLLVPPPPDVCDAMSQLVGRLMGDDRDDGSGESRESFTALPAINAPPLTGKVTSLIRAGQASAAVYREILVVLDAACDILCLDGPDVDGLSVSQPNGNFNDGGSSVIVKPLLKILEHDTGIEIESSSELREKFLSTMQVIEEVVSTHHLEHSLRNLQQLKHRRAHHFEDEGNEYSEREQISHFSSLIGDVVPYAFLERNEVIWRGRVKPQALKCADEVPRAAKRLAEAIAVDFWGVETEAEEKVAYDDNGDIDVTTAKEIKSPIVQDIFNNILALKTKPSWAKNTDTEKDYFHPRDRNNKLLRNRYTTERVSQAVSDYVEACDNARKEVMAVLTRLSWRLVEEGHDHNGRSGGHLISVAQASHMNLILATAAHHAAKSKKKDWSTGKIQDELDDHDADGKGGDNSDDFFHDVVRSESDNSAGHFVDVWPYWMDHSESVPNSFDLDGLFLLTAPNMSGKSTLMRSTAAAALLINCGLCAPCHKSTTLRRFDSIFVRGASADVPTEDKSAFGAEMGDVAALLRSCGNRSLVFVDEIGRGTSPKDGTSLAAAILERMSLMDMSGMFATHLHGIFGMNILGTERIRKKRMAIEENSGQLLWTYRLEDGVCTNSLALATAAKFGLPDSILQRAEQLNAEHGGVETHSDFRQGGPEINLVNAVKILEEYGNKESVVHIPPNYMSPPSLEGSSCVYVLELEDKRYYVGETDSLSQRLSQHRSKGKDWAKLNAIVLQIDGGKSSARNVESLVIQRMARSGFDMISISDGVRIRSSR